MHVELTAHKKIALVPGSSNVFNTNYLKVKTVSSIKFSKYLLLNGLLVTDLLFNKLADLGTYMYSM